MEIGEDKRVVSYNFRHNLHRQTMAEQTANSEANNSEHGLNVKEHRSSNNQSMGRDESRSILTRSNIGASSMQKLTGGAGGASRAQLVPQADMQNEIQRLESRIDTLETKIATSEQSLISKTAERLAKTLPYGAQIEQLQQNIGLIAQSLQQEILSKVTTLLTENIEVLLPDLPQMKKSIATVESQSNEQKTGGSKTFQLAKEAIEGVEELKGEFEYMKTRFSPQFVQRVDKALSSLTTLAYDVEVVKMTTTHAAMKKDLDMVEQRLQNYVLMPRFIELQHQCMDYANQKEVTRLDEEIEKTRLMLTKFVLKLDFNEKFKRVEQEIWEELATKMEKKSIERKFDHIEQSSDQEKKRTNKEMSAIREVFDRMRRKVDEANHSIIEIRGETDDKMSAKEGQKLWANFRKYAQYDELKDLYRKTMPAISQFEDKLKENNDHNDKIDIMMSRLDEIICLKSDKESVKEFRTIVEAQYITKSENEAVAKQTIERIGEFDKRMLEMEEMVKFQSRQLQKEMYSAVRRTFNQQQSKDENQPITMATVLSEMKSVVAVKADKDDLEQVVNEKANKVDTEMCMRWVDLLHKMVNKVVLLLTTKLKTDLDTGLETANQMQNKKVQMLQQGLLISKWIESFDSANINDFYFQTEREKQPQKIREVQMQFKRAIDDIDRTELSPNLKEINKHLKRTKDALDLRPDETKMAMTMAQMAQTSPKRLRLGGHSQDRFDQSFDAEKMMNRGDKTDRYMFAKTTKNAHPPKIGPRSTNKSVDPLTRKANLLPMKTTSGFGPTIKQAFGGSRRQSATNLNASTEDVRLTSKYATFDPNPPNNIDQTKNSSRLAKKKGSLKPSLRGSKLSGSRRSPDMTSKPELMKVDGGTESGAQTPMSNRKQSLLPSINTFY